ncbi:hypothetical protein BDZ89DRAFT_253643 [Hymenopellis radicata]|nr:hypothetical protein BDZ89DRAFT_253643 [Hymenopellis radicata]
MLHSSTLSMQLSERVLFPTRHWRCHCSLPSLISREHPRIPSNRDSTVPPYGDVHLGFEDAVTVLKALVKGKTQMDTADTRTVMGFHLLVCDSLKCSNHSNQVLSILRVDCDTTAHSHVRRMIGQLSIAGTVPSDFDTTSTICMRPSVNAVPNFRLPPR